MNKNELRQKNMPARKKSKSSRIRKRSMRRRHRRHQPVIIQPVYYYARRASGTRRPHHYEYSSISNPNSVHEHLNRVNYSPDHELSVQDRIQRQLKQNAKNYRPNYMHVSSEELAIPAPRRVNGMRVFTNV